MVQIQNCMLQKLAIPTHNVRKKLCAYEFYKMVNITKRYITGLAGHNLTLDLVRQTQQNSSNLYPKVEHCMTPVSHAISIDTIFSQI
jgi:hypothetical protein